MCVYANLNCSWKTVFNQFSDVINWKCRDLTMCFNQVGNAGLQPTLVQFNVKNCFSLFFVVVRSVMQAYIVQFNANEDLFCCCLEVETETFYSDQYQID